VAGTVAEVAARAGQQVAMDARLAVIEAEPEDGGLTPQR
jgi:biotin carboxyl carrier protein